jgi:hypothetical protein
MTSTGTASAVAVEKFAAENGWKFFLTATCLIAELEAWEQTSTPAGPLLSARVSGPQAAEAVRRIASAGDMAGVGAFHRAQLDYTVPGRVACVWQSNGVWVELWHPDPLTPAPAPVAAPVAASVPASSQAAQSTPKPSPGPSARRSFLRRPSGRLPFTRKQRTTTDKETTR